MNPVVVMTTVGAGFDAASLATELVERKLVACVNIVGPVQSVYRWEDRIENAPEQLLIMKTVEEHLAELRELLRHRHPYEVPEFVVLPVRETSEAYGAWLEASTH